jgi:hypothetical protein
MYKTKTIDSIFEEISSYKDEIAQLKDRIKLLKEDASKDPDIINKAFATNFEELFKDSDLNKAIFKVEKFCGQFKLSLINTPSIVEKSFLVKLKELFKNE